MNAFERLRRRHHLLETLQQLLSLNEWSFDHIESLLEDGRQCCEGSLESQDFLGQVLKILPPFDPLYAARRMQFLVQVHEIFEAWEEAFLLRVEWIKILHLQGYLSQALILAKDLVKRTKSWDFQRYEALLVLMELLLEADLVEDARLCHEDVGQAFEGVEFGWYILGAKVYARLGEDLQALCFLEQAQKALKATKDFYAPILWALVGAYVHQAAGRQQQALSDLETAFCAIPTHSLEALERKIEVGLQWHAAMDSLDRVKAQEIERQVSHLRTRMASLKGGHLKLVPKTED